MPGFIDLLLPTAYNTAPDELGKQDSEFYKIAWKQKKQIVPKPGEFIRNELGKIMGFKEVARLLRLDKLAQKLNTSSNPYFSFHGKSLVDINNAIGGSSFKDVHWRAEVEAGIQPPGVTTLEPLGRIRIKNVRIAEKHGSMFHEHQVFESIDFEDIIIVFAFKGSTQKLKIHLDHSSPDYIHGMRAQTVNRFAGSDGIKGESKKPESSKHQLGLSQNHLYGFRCGNILIGVWVRFSFVFGYPKNDFEPSGSINACKCSPQINFSHFVQNIDQIPSNIDWQSKFQNVKNISNIIPAGTTENSIFVERYKSRIKMVVNVNSSHHINRQTIGGRDYDANFLGDLRATDVDKIPRQFERVLDPIYYGTGNTRNILGLYTDSNNNNNDSARIRGPYLGPAGVELPAWSNIFDYANYDIQNSLQFIAVHGVQTPKLTKFFDRKFWPIRGSKTYPVGSSLNGYKVDKFPRQGAYDNIHLHGYLGHYLNDDGSTGNLVIHAPICGYCCFHMHWRWSPLNVTVAGSTVASYPIIGKGFDNSDKFKGWNNKKSNQVPGNVQVPDNHHVHIAVTEATDSFIPATKDGNIISQSSSSPSSWNGDVINGTSQLDKNKKCIWYCSDILEIRPNASHVVLEQGCGYAYDYNHSVADNIILAQVRTIFPIVTGGVNINDYFRYIILNFRYDSYTDLIDYMMALTSPADNKSITSWRFEIQYRLMRFFNRAEISPNSQDYTANPMLYVAKYSDIINYNKNYLLNEIDQIPTRVSDPLLLAFFSNL